MKLEHYISNTIKRWPDLYVMDDYQTSRLAVLDNLFFTIGTENEWCKGGFLAEHLRGRTGDKRNFRIFKEDAKFEDGFFERYSILQKTHYKLFRYDKLQVNPYPVFDGSALSEMIDGKTNSLHIKNFELTKILPDWIEGAREIVEYAIGYYKDESMFKRHCYYPKDSNFTFWDKYVIDQNDYFTRFLQKFPK